MIPRPAISAFRVSDPYPRRRWPILPVGAHVSGERPPGESQPSWKPIACRSSSPTRRAGRSRRRATTPPSCATRRSGIYVHAPYLINVCSPKPNIRHGSRKILHADLRSGRRRRRDRGDRPPGPRRGRDRRGRRSLDQHARAGGVRGARSTSRTRPEARTPSPAASTRWPSSGRRSGRRRPRTTSASASTPATRTPPARSSPTRSSGRARSPAGSTSSTPTTHATRPEPEPTATPTSARATSTSISCAT